MGATKTVYRADAAAGRFVEVLPGGRRLEEWQGMGIAWGYSGTGSRMFTCALLHDVTGEPVASYDDDLVWVMRDDIAAFLPRAWEMDAADLLTWIETEAPKRVREFRREMRGQLNEPVLATGGDDSVPVCPIVPFWRTLTRKTSLYRCRSVTGDLLYVGITDHGIRRFAGHNKTKTWWSDVAHIDVEHFTSRAAAHQAEIEAIHTERPRYNKQHAWQ